MSEGYCLISLNDELYYKLCKRLIENIRKYDSQRPICVFYDNDELKNKYFSTEQINPDKYIFKLFDSEKIIEQYGLQKCNINLENSWNKYGLIPKLFHIVLSPFEKSLFFDVDMIINTDFEMFWNYLEKSPYPFMIPGESDSNNRSPYHWHWGAISSVMHSCGFSVPQLFTTIIGSRGVNHQDYINCIKIILCNRHQWNIQEKFRDGIVDEIIFACLFGLHSYRPHNELFNFLHHSGKIDPINKEVQ
jgi:hypothetical protein